MHHQWEVDQQRGFRNISLTLTKAELAAFGIVDIAAIETKGNGGASLTSEDTGVSFRGYRTAKCITMRVSSELGISKLLSPAFVWGLLCTLSWNNSQTVDRGYNGILSHSKYRGIETVSNATCEILMTAQNSVYLWQSLREKTRKCSNHASNPSHRKPHKVPQIRRKEKTLSGQHGWQIGPEYHARSTTR